jgi:hypothetical protein
MVDNVQATSLLDSVLKAQTTSVEIGVRMLKKSQDAATQQGEALVQMIENSGPKENGRLLDTYA